VPNNVLIVWEGYQYMQFFHASLFEEYSRPSSLAVISGRHIVPHVPGLLRLVRATLLMETSVDVEDTPWLNSVCFWM
jgi:hypothetical protein